MIRPKHLRDFLKFGLLGIKTDIGTFENSSPATHQVAGEPQITYRLSPPRTGGVADADREGAELCEAGWGKEIVTSLGFPISPCRLLEPGNS